MELLSTILDPSNPNKQLKMIQIMNTNEKGNLTHCTIFDFIYYGHNTTPILPKPNYSDQPLLQM